MMLKYGFTSGAQASIVWGLVTLLMVAGCASVGSTGETSERAPEKYRSGDVRTINIPGTKVSFNLVFVPAGTYQIGSPEFEAGRSQEEGPQYIAVLSGYWIGQFEVTDDEFAVFRFPDRDADTTAVQGAVYKVDGVSRPSPPYEDPAFGLGGAGKPAVGMTQWGAMHYARWLTEKTGIFFRLPTEAEWETACKAGSEDTFGFGNDPASLSDFAWNAENSEQKLHDVGTLQPNQWGLFDMHGNAAEWTMDQYDRAFYATMDPNSEANTHVNPWSLPTKLHPRTVRGGSFYDDAPGMRCASRLESTLNWKRRDPQIPKSFWWNTDAPFLGFRIVAPTEEMTEEELAAFWTLVLGE